MLLFYAESLGFPRCQVIAKITEFLLDAVRNKCPTGGINGNCRLLGISWTRFVTNALQGASMGIADYWVSPGRGS